MTAKTRCQRRAPFLHRNWIKGVKAWQDSTAMGNIVSSPVHKGSHQVDDDDAPPHKRRRISSPDPFEVDHLIASPRTSDSRSALAIEVLRVLHKDSKKVRSYQTHTVPRDVMKTKASCRVTIFELSSGYHRVLHCQSQVCDLTTFKNPVGPNRIARVDLPRPFYIPEESILINRSEDSKFDLADSYELLVELEAAHDGHWPPLDSNDFGFSPTFTSTLGRTCVLSSRFDQIFGRHKSPLSLAAGYPSNKSAHQTDYLMDIDLRWTSGFKALRRLEKGSMPCINAIDPGTDPFISDDPFAPSLDGGLNGMNGISGTNGHHIDESSLELEDEAVDGAQTPSRSLRTREKNKVYNLKVLSDQAQGRERKRRARGNAAATSEGRVSYLLPSDQPICLDYYRCITCGAYHQTMQQLQLHLQTFHPAYEYMLETTSQGPQFRVTSRRESVSSPIKQYQINQPVKPFNLQTFIAGDHSWVTSRLGPDTIDDVFTFSKDKTKYERLPSHSPVATQRTIQRRPGRPKGSKVLVPNIPQPLFDPISRTRLIPGQEVPKPIPDSTWLIQKHREAIGDFSDVTPAEKEYIWEWDGYILRQNLTSAAYFPRAWLEFVRQKASWLIAADQRMMEFGKHTSVLLARDLLDDKTMQEAFSYINEARAQPQPKTDDSPRSAKPTEAGTKHSPRAAQIRKSANGCTICQLPVLGPRMLVCSNKTCSHRLYHSDCIEKDATTPISRREWFCNACSGLERPV